MLSGIVNCLVVLIPDLTRATLIIKLSRLLLYACVYKRH